MSSAKSETTHRTTSRVVTSKEQEGVGEQRASRRWLKGSMGEQRASKGEQWGSKWTKQVLVREHTGSRVAESEDVG